MRRLVFLAMLLCAQPAWAANYLIANDVGDDTRPCVGTIEANTPDFINGLRKTIAGAMACGLSAGDRITLVGNRDLTVAIFTGALNSIDSATLALPNGASSVTPTIIQAWQGHYGMVVLRPPDGTSAFAIRSAKTDITIRHLVLDGSLQTGSTPLCTIYGGASGIILDHVEVKNSPVQGCLITNTTAAANSNTIRRSFFHNNAGDGLTILTASNTIQDNWFYSNSGDGLDISGSAGADTNAVTRNLSYDNTGWGFILGDNAGGNGNTAYNNLAYRNGGGFKLQGTSTDLSHNTSYGNTPNEGILIVASANSVLVKNDIAYGNATNITNSGTSTTQTTNQTSDPSFSNAAAGDFTLGALSTARGAGTTLGTVTRDYRKYPRPTGAAVDIGAYEMPIGCPAGVCTLVAADDLQTKLYEANCGDTIKLTDGNEWASGPYVLPSKNPCTTPTVITRTGTLPASYDVITNCYQQGPTFLDEMAKRDACWAAMRTQYTTNAPIVTMTQAQVQASQGVLFSAAFDADYWSFQGVFLRTTNTNTGGGVTANALVAFGKDGSGNALGGYSGEDATMVGQLPDHISFDRVVLQSLVGRLTHGVVMEVSNLTVTDTLCEGAKDLSGSDSQCFYSGGHGTGPFSFDNVFFEATGENILWGGGGTVFHNATSANITVTDSYFTKNWTQWEFCSRLTTDFGYPCTYGGQYYQPKNAFECKNCKSLVAHGNVFEGNWYVNVAPCVLYQAVSNGDGAFWTTVKDVEMYGNVFRHCGTGINISGKGGQNGGATTGYNFNIHDNLFYDLNARYREDAGGSGKWFGLFSNSSIGDVHTPFDRITFNHNTVDNDGGSGASIEGTGDLFTNLVITNNIWRAINNFAAISFQCGCNGGTEGFDIMAPASYTVANNVIASPGLEFTWPTNTWFEKAAGDTAATLLLYKAIFIDRDGGDYTVEPSSVYKAGGARDATDNKDLGADMSLLPNGPDVVVPPASAPSRLRFHAANHWLVPPGTFRHGPERVVVAVHEPLDQEADHHQREAGPHFARERAHGVTNSAAGLGATIGSGSATFSRTARNSSTH